ncbi:MAG: hypothetical protein K0S08_1449 [Gammaproteobacteria bacterium]|jgi:hypothetical protein|nr:hypothetical protein [Gammaproteobacteria bacterium]
MAGKRKDCDRSATCEQIDLEEIFEELSLEDKEVTSLGLSSVLPLRDRASAKILCSNNSTLEERLLSCWMKGPEQEVSLFQQPDDNKTFQPLDENDYETLEKETLSDTRQHLSG